MASKWIRLRIYIGESDKYHGTPLYLYILRLLRSNGIRGATVLKGLAGYGSHSMIHLPAVLRLSEDLPLVIETVDEPEKIEKILPKIKEVVKEGLITKEEVEVVFYGHGGKHH
ncbi:MAG: DUF190 domain-containing protein [Crenarchaeota archaeon]|nr:DUF190 domain-containing protein [Thermoproteota archaeon]